MSYRTSNLQMLHFIYLLTNIRTEYFKHAAHSPFFFSSKCRLFHNATCFGSYVIHILYTECAKIKKKKSGSKGLIPPSLLLTLCTFGANIKKIVHSSHRVHLYFCVSYGFQNKSYYCPDATLTFRNRVSSV